MTEVASSAPVAAAVVTRVFHEQWGRCLATVARLTGDLDVAEDAVQEAFVSALRRWPAAGVPRNPGAWITTTARNQAMDRLRREARRGGKEHAALRALELTASEPAQMLHPVEDDQLRLIFTCCHPALSAPAQVGLTLRLVVGLTTTQIARAFLEPEPTVAQRLSRAKRRIRTAGIPLRTPPVEQLADRLPPVLACVHLIYREGYAATGGQDLIRADLCDEGRRLGALLARLLPAEPEALGLHALLLLHDARRAARVTAQGDPVLLPDQDRHAWDASAIAQGLMVLDQATALRRPGTYQLQAAIAAEHARAPTWESTDWRTIVALYEALAQRLPSPVVELNRAIATAQLHGPAAGLTILDAVGDDPRLNRSHLLPAARAHLLRELGRIGEARAAYRQAQALAPSAAEERFLAGRIAELEGAEPTAG